MKYKNRVVCFIDILGFQSLIDRTIHKDGTDNEEKIDQLIEAISHIRDILDIDKENIQESKIITQFSDSIVISFSYSEESGVFWTLLEIQWLLIGLVYRGIICRGGIAVGKLIHTTTMLFGPALIAAYKMESEAANYPRVILDDSIVELAGVYKSSHHSSEQEKDYVRQCLGQDSDGMYYIDYFESAQSELNDPELDYPIYLYKLSEIIAKGIDSNNPSIKIKYMWVKEKYNSVVKSIKAGVESLPEGDELKEAYQSLPLF